MAIKFAPKDPAKEKPVAAAKPAPAATKPVDDTVGDDTAGGEGGSDLFGGKGAAGKRKRK